MDLMFVLEIAATLAGLTHVFLLTREKVEAWVFGIITVTIYVYIFYVSKLYSDAILHVFYILMNSYGWYNWSRRKEETALVKITRLSNNHIAVAGGAIVVGTILWGMLMDAQTDAAVPYFDAFTTVASLIAQYLLTQKKIDNWVIWIAVNLVAIPIYLYKGLYVTSGLYFVYLLMCISGFVEWRKELRQNVTRNGVPRMKEN